MECPVFTPSLNPKAKSHPSRAGLARVPLIEDDRVERSFSAEVKALAKEERGIIGMAISAIQEAFGNLHVHSSNWSCKLRSGVYEARFDLGLRLLFEMGRSVFSSISSKPSLMPKRRVSPSCDESPDKLHRT
jgi:hypothetical protein